MGEFAPVASLGGGVVPLRANTDPQAAVLAPVAASSGGRGAQARMDTMPPQTARPVTRDQPGGDTPGEKSERPQVDDFTLIGPTPAFQANVLELERDLQRAIERLEGERGRVEAEAAIRIKDAEVRAEAAETDNARAAAETPAPREPAAEARPGTSVPAAGSDAEPPATRVRAEDDG